MSNEKVGLMDDINIDENQEVSAENEDSSSNMEVSAQNNDDILNFLPEEFLDKEKNQHKTIELFEAYKKQEKIALDLRRKVSKGLPEAPKDINEYEVELEEDIRDFIQAEDPLLNAFKRNALDAGISKEQYQKIIPGILRDLLAGGVIKPTLSEEDKETARAKFQQEEMAKLGENGEKIIAGVKQEISSLVRAGDLTKEDLEVFKDIAFDAAGIQFVNRLLGRRRAQGEMPIHATNMGNYTQPEIEQMQADPRYQTDPAYRQKVISAWKTFFGE